MQAPQFTQRCRSIFTRNRLTRSSDQLTNPKGQTTWQNGRYTPADRASAMTMVMPIDTLSMSRLNRPKGFTK